MKTAARPIEMICEFLRDGTIDLQRFRVEGKNGLQVIYVDRVINYEIDNYAGNKMRKYTCESEINGKKWTYVIKYELLTCKWLLFTI